MNYDHPNQDTDPENDGHDDEFVCMECGIWADHVTHSNRCRYCTDGHGPDNDKDLDSERAGGYTFDVAAFFDTRKS